MHWYTMYSTQLLKGTFQTIILQVLHQHKRMYGYEITQKVKVLSDNEIVVTEGSLYPILHKMEEMGWVTAERVSIGNRTRRYYSITQSGSSSLKLKVDEFERFARTMKNIFYPKPA